MNKLKTFFVFVLAFSLGEFITAYRLESKEFGLWEYAKAYFSSSKKLLVESYMTGYEAPGNWTKSKKRMARLMFPNRKI